jgi:hypothetical protein
MVDMANGKIRLNRWQTPDAVINAQRIANLWAAQIGASVERIDDLTRYLLSRVRRNAVSKRGLGTFRQGETPLTLGLWAGLLYSVKAAG